MGMPSGATDIPRRNPPISHGVAKVFALSILRGLRLSSVHESALTNDAALGTACASSTVEDDSQF
jgi:hypothetical protein